ncbi:2-succinyl-5-enolpyruvyl-6-hydroxy-3-cyclohexene-1-carboxylic-acid synthase [Reichenbachiella sp. 5M10]|uniref:2-succinyl-5-enolpyruvyl-6-hydroxy-3- cyclohexene-1-carboxylic-acid synthase n=1 Tax=Reichenbachiella sp. 5M10 TaxID=1889772 RepID=UPI000C15EA4A|nr:2-succinyl-5-enolpyruvyl-6-hydroxy-3-cyclohexene-1-carboxylic-acid synthase [Reichenbachiella sp. 5M10]PIB35361.1 2-succinyl-5-enolpyruvyl-6-hydroxy-3-cyclohexene-1-carboxylic-acid synthase [Reichenbachiella sp. 5M10]
MNLQPIFDIPELCHQHGVVHAVISPGSRNAALTIAFARHPRIQCYSIPDERSAAFIALGLSLHTHHPTVLICTSGSAGLNYAPAVAEAYFNQVPLLVLTADRPPELIGKRDGQTIYQRALFGPHAKAYFDFPSFEETPGNACIQSALHTTTSQAPGPVHVNIPFREPFYPEANKVYRATPGLQVTPIAPPDCPTPPVDTAALDSIQNYQKTILIVGQGTCDPRTVALLNTLSEQLRIPIIADVISNAHRVTHAIQHQDLFLSQNDPALRPDLVLSMGLSVVSKNLKLYLKSIEGLIHWHITPNDDAADTYDCLSQTIPTTPEDFCQTWISKHSSPSIEREAFYNKWQAANQKAAQVIQNLSTRTWTETSLYHELLSQLPVPLDLHLANSMAVRYANVIGVQDPNIQVYCNRGTSGIDGSNSTAVGTCLASGRNTLLLTGDVAFLYDRNAFWHNHLPDNFKIVVFNNNGGGIFRMIEGPSAQPELKPFFETDQQSNASHVAGEFGFRYYGVDDYTAWDDQLTDFLDYSQGRAILEIHSDAQQNKIAYKQLFKNMKELALSH